MSRPILHRAFTGVAGVAALVSAVPGTVCAQTADGRQALSHLGTDKIIIAILLCNTLLLLGFLFKLAQMRRDSHHQCRVISKRDRHIHLLDDNLPNVAVFQCVRDARLRLLFTHLGDGYEQILGVARERIMKDARIALDYVYEEDLPVLQEAYEKSAEEQAVLDIELRVLDVSGALKWIHISAVPHQEKKKIVWDGFIQDISEIKRAAGELLEEKKNFKTLFEAITDLLIACNLDGDLLHANPAVLQRLEYSEEEIETMSLLDLYPDDLHSEVAEALAVPPRDGAVLCSVPLQAKDGKQFPAVMHLFRGVWDGRPALLGISRDVVNHRGVEDSLREPQHMLQLIMNAIPVAVSWQGTDSVYLGCNETFAREAGLRSIGEVTGKTPLDLFGRGTGEEIIQLDRQIVESNDPVFNESESYTRPDGDTGWRESNKIPLHDEDGTVVGLLGIWRDITDHKWAEERLRRTLEDMERFNQLMRGRERRTLELKDEVNELLKKLGQQPKYRTTTKR